MKNQITNNWLKPFRDQQSYTQEALAVELKENIKTVQRWEQYDEKAKEIPFELLAQILQTSEQELKKAYQAGLYQHKIKKHKQQPVNKILIIKVLKNCEPIGLTREILEKMQVDDVEKATEQIISWLQQGKMLEFIKHFNQPIKTAVEKVNTLSDFDLIQQLVEQIALAATIPFDANKLENDQQFQVHGVTKAWPIRLMIDANLGGSMTGISAKTSTELKTLGGVKIEEPTEDKVWWVAHAIIKNLWDDLLIDEEPFPDLSEDEAHHELPDEEQYPDFTQFCKNRVDAVIDQTNFEIKHCFLYSLQKEPQLVQQRVLMLLPSIRVFNCSEHPQAMPVLRFEEKRLEAWIANALFSIQKQREKIKSIKPVEETTMNSKDNKGTHVYVVDGGEGGVTLASENSNITQITLSSDSAEMSDLLKQILEITDRSTPEHQQLRVDVNDILNALQTKQKPPEEAKNWLQEGLTKLKLPENIKNGTALITLVEKSLGLIDKL